MLTVGIGDCKVTKDRDAVLTTYGLGSCISVVVHDPAVCVGGLLHFMLPDSTLDRPKSEARPYLFADTGIPLLFRSTYELGAQKDRMIVRIIGGAQVLDREGVFNIGKRNYQAVRKILWRAGVLVHSEQVGGAASRTVRLEVSSGQTWIRSAQDPGLAPGPRQVEPGGLKWQLMC